VSHYLQKGHELKKLLNLSNIEKKFYIQSMNIEHEKKVKYDIEKMKLFFKGLGGG